MTLLGAVLEEFFEEGRIGRPRCISLNDRNPVVDSYEYVTSNLDYWGAARSKIRFTANCLFSNRSADVVLVGHPALAPVAYAMKQLGKAERYVVIVHGVEAWQKLNPVIRVALRGAEQIICTTPYTRDECARTNGIPTNNFKVIPLCHRTDEPKHINPPLRPSGPLRILTVGRQDATELYKGYDTLIESIYRLIQENRSVQLTLAGSGDDHCRLKRKADALGLRDHVRFLGEVCDEELEDAYASCDVFALPSKKEGFGIVFLEAMRHSKPCIGGNHGGTPSVIDHGGTGFLVEYGDIDALSTYITELENNRAFAAELGAAGYQKLKSSYSPEMFRAAYERIIFEDHS